jgi:hypothetical protein
VGQTIGFPFELVVQRSEKAGISYFGYREEGVVLLGEAYASSS